MEQKPRIVVCPDCGDAVEAPPVDRRNFLRSAAAAAAAAAPPKVWATPRAAAAPTPKSAAESAVKALYDALNDKQKKEVCFDWDHKHPQLGLLRTYVSNNWHITKPTIESDFYTKDQKALIREVYK